MMATSLVQVFRNLECRVCGRTCRDPRNLTCSHTFCRVCLETLLASHLRTDVLLCPTCRRGTWVPDGDVDGLQSNITAGSRLSSVRLSAGFQFGQISRPCTSMSRQSEPKLVLLALLPVGGTVNGMAISPDNHVAVCCCNGGILVYSSEGIRQGTVLESVKVHDVHFMIHTGYVIRDSYNRIYRYTDHSERLHHETFETKHSSNGTSGGLTVGRDGLIFVGYDVVKRIQVFQPEGGRAIREITCSGFPVRQIFAMTSSQAIVVKSNFEVHLIDDVSGAIRYSISNNGEEPYPAVCRNKSVIIAWVKRDLGLLSIVKYTRESNRGINILTDFNISTPCLDCYLQVFNTGEIAFCTRDRLYIFHETRENGYRFADATLSLTY